MASERDVTNPEEPGAEEVMSPAEIQRRMKEGHRENEAFVEATRRLPDAAGKAEQYEDVPGDRVGG